MTSAETLRGLLVRGTDAELRQAMSRIEAELRERERIRAAARDARPAQLPPGCWSEDDLDLDGVGL